MNRIIAEDVRTIIQSGAQMWEEFASSTILVAGANGLIPYYFAATLLALNDSILKGRECHVIALVRNRQKAEVRFSGLLQRTDISLLVQDVVTPVNTDRPVDYIIHSASQASPKYYGIDPIGTILPNILGTRNLLDLAYRKKSRNFLFLSGGEIYGILPEDKVPTKETDYGWLDPVNVRSCYAEGKRAGETLCAIWNKQYGVPARIARLAHTYGPGLDFNDGRVFADLVGDVVNGRDIELNSDGSAFRSFCYVSEAVTGMFLVMLKGEAGRAYNVCNESACVSIRVLAETLAGLFPEKNISVKISPAKTQSGYMKSPVTTSCLDSSLLRSLGWAPVIGIKEGFRRTVLSFNPENL